jgi:hypothetical protein
LPDSPSDWLSADHQVYFLLDLVDELDFTVTLIPVKSKNPRGEKVSSCGCKRALPRSG